MESEWKRRSILEAELPAMKTIAHTWGAVLARMDLMRMGGAGHPSLLRRVDFREGRLPVHYVQIARAVTVLNNPVPYPLWWRRVPRKQVGLYVADRAGLSNAMRPSARAEWLAEITKTYESKLAALK